MKRVVEVVEVGLRCLVKGCVVDSASMELQRTSHKDPKGSSKCALVVHSGGLWTSETLQQDGEGKTRAIGTESVLVNR